MFRTPIVMLDFETTGLSPATGARITEVAALRIADGKVVERYVSLVNCGVQIPSFITSLTGITQQMVDSAPCVSKVVPELVRFIGADALAAHNASFDEKFLVAEASSQGLRSSHAHLLCSLKLSRRLLPGMPGYGLGKLSNALGIRFSGNAHRAEADAEVSAALLLQLGARICASYQVSSLDTALLARLGKVSAAKTPAFLARELSPAPAN